jgi:PglZ domain-containing protein
LRYDCAHALKERLTGQHVQIHAVRAALPTVIPIGMTALLPLGSASIELEIEHNALHPKVNGKDTAVRANRLAFLADFGADCRDIEDLENVATRPPNLGNLLVVFGHEEVDHLGHGSADTLIRHMDREIERLAHLIRKLHHWGYPEVHVVTDHGFILLDEDRLPPEVHCEKDWCYLRKERFALVPASADIPLATLPCQWNDQMRLAVPPGLAFFTAEKSFAHGGIALQEMVIPHLISRSQTPARRLGIEVVLPTFELLRTAVKVTLRPQPQGQPQTGQLPLFAESGRTLRLDVYRTNPAGTRQSVLTPGRSKEVQLAASSPEVHVTLFFHTALSFQRGELLDLDIRDVATSEQFPPGGIKLTVGRDM